jgi:hypothetical protein
LKTGLDPERVEDHSLAKLTHGSDVMFGWSSTSSADTAPAAEGGVPPAPVAIGRSGLTRLLVDRIQDSRRDPFAVVMLDLAGRASGSDRPPQPLPAAAREHIAQRLQTRLSQLAGHGELDESLSVFILAGADTRAALEPLRQALAELCQHNVLADRQCYSVRWRLAATFYPRDGHAPCRLLHDVQALLRNEPWHDGVSAPRGAAQAATPVRAPALSELRVPVATDPLALF